MKKMFKMKNGITLVALAITVIILLILAGISIVTLTGSGLFEKAKLAEQESKNAQELEDSILKDYENKINGYLDGTRAEKPKRTLLWEGTADTANIEYKFSNSTYDIENYDAVIIEYTQKETHRSSVILNTENLTKNKVTDIALWGYSTRYTRMHFIDNGFIIDGLHSDGNLYVYVKNIYGINY